MLIVPNHHVIVPKTMEVSTRIADVVDDPQLKRRAQIQRFVLNNTTEITLDFVPLSDQWLELYLDGYRIINPRYANHDHVGIRYEEYHMSDLNKIRFENPQTGNLKVISDTLAYAPSEHRINDKQAGVRIVFDNIQSYDVFEKHFTPSRYPMPELGLFHTVIRIRVGDAHWSEPLALTQPCYGYVRLSLDRKSFIYVPRPGFKGWDVFGYTLITTHGQIGMPQGITVQVGADEEYYNYSAEFTGNVGHLSIRDFKYPAFTPLAGKKLTFEFYYYTRSVNSTHAFRVGIFGNFRTAMLPGSYAIYLQSSSTTGGQVVIFQYLIATTDVYGAPVNKEYKVSSKARLDQGRWHHVVIQVDGTNIANATITMYLDGYAEFFYNNDFSAQTVYNNQYFTIGKVQDDNTSQILDGYISNFRITKNQLVYSGERTLIPRRTLAITGNTHVLGIVNAITDPESVTDMTDASRIQKIGNVDIVSIGPFSPLVLQNTNYEVMHGEKFRVSTKADYICVDTVVEWAINTNISLGVQNTGFWSANAPKLTISSINQLDEIVTTTNGFTGNFIIDDIEHLDFTVDTHTDPMTSRRRFDLYLPQYPLMIETIDVLADYDGLVMNIQPGNDGFARDVVNFSHGTLTSLGSYKPSLGGHFDFNGTTDIIQGGHNRAIDITGDITCEVWFRIRNPSVQKIRIFGKGTTGNLTYGLFYDTSNNAISFTRDRLSGDMNVTYTASSSIVGSWQQVVAVTNGEQQAIYINSVKQAEEIYGTDLCISSNLGYTIGSNIGSLGFHDGLVSVVRVYNRALSAGEITTNFNQYKSRYGL